MLDFLNIIVDKVNSYRYYTRKLIFTEIVIVDEQKLYIMKNSFGLLKIGISNCPETRANTLRLSSGVSVEVLKIISCNSAYKVEQWLHSQFKDVRMEGEWFKDIAVSDIVKRTYLHESFKITTEPVESYKKLPCQTAEFIKEKLKPFCKYRYNCKPYWERSKRLEDILGFLPLECEEVSSGTVIKGIHKYFPDPYIVSRSHLDHDINGVQRVADLVGTCVSNLKGYAFMPDKETALAFQKDKLINTIEGYENHLENLYQVLDHSFKVERYKTSHRKGIEKAKAEGKFKGKQQSDKTVQACKLALKLIKNGTSKARAAKESNIGIATLYRYIKANDIS